MNTMYTVQEHSGQYHKVQFMHECTVPLVLDCIQAVSMCGGMAEMILCGFIVAESYTVTASVLFLF